MKIKARDIQTREFIRVLLDQDGTNYKYVDEFTFFTEEELKPHTYQRILVFPYSRFIDVNQPPVKEPPAGSLV